jgi:hypothetical protein
MAESDLEHPVCCPYIERANRGFVLTSCLPLHDAHDKPPEKATGMRRLARDKFGPTHLRERPHLAARPAAS